MAAEGEETPHVPVETAPIGEGKDAAKAKLELHLETKPDQARLEAVGKIKDPETEAMRQLAKAEAKIQLDKKLGGAPDKETLVASGKIKDEEAVAAKKKEKEDTKSALEAGIAARKPLEEVVAEGKISEKDAKKMQGVEEPKKPKVHESLADTAGSLEAKLQMQPDKSRLENKGIIQEPGAKKERMDSAKSALETKLHPEIRPTKESLEARGRIKDTDTHEAQKKEKQDAKAALEAHFSGGAAPPAERKEAEEVAPMAQRGADWRNRAEHIFHQIDLDDSMSLEKTELVAVLGSDSDALVAKIQEDPDKCVITLKTWMDHMNKLQATGIAPANGDPNDGLEAFLVHCENKIDKYVMKQAEKRVAAKAQESAAAKEAAEKEAKKNLLESHLTTRPDKGFLEQKGKIKDVETHEAQKAEAAENKKALAEKMAAQPNKADLEAKGLIKPHDESKHAPLPTPEGYDWRNRAEVIFSDMDLDSSGTLEKSEIESVCGADADFILKQLVAMEEHGKVTLKEWVKRVEQLKEAHDMKAVDTFLNFCEKKVKEYLAEKNARKDKLKREQEKAKANQSEETKATKAALEGKLLMQPDKERLEAKGIIKDKAAQEVAKMNKAAAAQSLESKLNLQPDKEALVAKGKIKDKETHEAQKQEKLEAKLNLEEALSAQPTKAELHGAGKMKLTFKPRDQPEVVKAIYAKHEIPGKGHLDLVGPEFRAALQEVADSFSVPLNLDAIISDAKAELDCPPDLEGFFECLDVVESLLDIYLK